MMWLPNTMTYPRLGLVVPKHRATAVARNRLRRQLRELWRREIQPVQGSLDLVIRAKAAAYAAAATTLRNELHSWRDAAAASA